MKISVLQTRGLQSAETVVGLEDRGRRENFSLQVLKHGGQMEIAVLTDVFATDVAL